MLEGKRSERVADLIRKEIAEMIIHRTIKDPRIGFVTITRVSVSDDCRMAKVYFSVMGTQRERVKACEGLQSAKGYVRKELGRRIGLRYTPELYFQFDPSVEYSIRLNELIHRIHEDKEEEEIGD